jgi:META domain
MGSVNFALRERGVALLLLSSILLTSILFTCGSAVQARAQDGFPFGMEMTLDALPQPGSKRIPDLDIGDNGEVVLELWCKGGKGQFSVAGNTVIFVAGPMEDRACPPARAQADDELVAALTESNTWRRQGDSVSFVGSKTLRFRLNTN